MLDIQGGSEYEHKSTASLTQCQRRIVCFTILFVRTLMRESTEQIMTLNELYLDLDIDDCNAFNRALCYRSLCR